MFPPNVISMISLKNAKRSDLSLRELPDSIRKEECTVTTEALRVMSPLNAVITLAASIFEKIGLPVSLRAMTYRVFTDC